MQISGSSGIYFLTAVKYHRGVKNSFFDATMKTCPHCSTQYSDDTLSFCLQDGAALAGYEIPEIPTVVIGETETVAARRSSAYGAQSALPGSAAWAPSQVTHVAGTQPPQRSNTLVAVLVTVFGMLALFIIAGIGAVFYFRGQTVVTPTVTNLNSTSGPTVPVTAASPVYSPQPAATRQEAISVPTSPVLPTADPSQVSREVSQRIDNWRSLTESKDLNSLSALYASRLAYYYSKRNVGVNSVISDKERAFRDFTSINIRISNMNVTPDPSGQSALAVFDKNWTFDGSKPWVGRIRSQLELRKQNGIWLITGERDIPGTYQRIR